MEQHQVNLSGYRSSADFFIGSSTVSTIPERAPFALKNMRTILFDLDRHIINTDVAFEAWWQAGLAVLSEALCPGTLDLNDLLLKTQASFHTIFFFHRLDLVPAIVEIASSLELDIRVLSERVFLSAHKAYSDALQVSDDIRTMLAAARTFADSAHAKFALVTGGSRNHTLDKLEATGLGSYFDVIFCGGGRPHPFEDDPERGYIARSQLESKLLVTPAGVTKRDTSFFRWVLSELNVPAKFALVCGDHPLEDVQHIQQLGGYGAQATWYNDKQHKGVIPDVVLLCPTQLTTMFERA